MDIIDTNRFTLFSNLYTGKKRIKDPKTGKKITVDVGFDSVEPQITAAINLANAFRSLHRAGMAYLDINDGGFYIDVKTGDLLVCDCDNISGSSNNECKLVLGTSGYLAPELVDDPDCGLPNMDTDKHSLAVLLFMLLIWGKPFDGKLLSGVMVSKSNEKDFYGTKTAVFVYHPTNSNNRPISSNSNVLKFWKEMTPAVQKYFTQCFTEGITKPTKRPTENRWTQALNSLRAGFVKCPCGGGEEYANEKNLKKNQYCCPHCRKAYHTLYFPGNGDRYPLMRGKKIFAVSIGAESIHQTIGDVGEKKSGKDIIIGMVNSSNMDWNIIDGGKTYVVNPGRGFPLNKGTMIEFRYKEKSGKDELVRTGKGVVE